MATPDAAPRNAQGSAAWFTTTHWTVVLQAREPDPARSRDALEKLCRTYWPPLYAYIRRQGYRPEDAQDLTQEFFSRLLQKEWLDRLHHQRGKFRSFLLTFLKHFLSDERDRAHAQKRGGGQQALPLDEANAEERYNIEAVDSLTAEQLYERRWAQTLLEQAVGRLRAEYFAEDKGALYDTLKDLQPGERGDVTYVELAARLGMSEAGIKSAVHRLRQRHREILREEIANTVSSPAEIDEEIRHLISVLGR
jgi:RNA polymerase sigma factor (sigma-70 family)